MFKGSIVALITPFTESGEVDYSALQSLVQWHIESGTDALVLCGTTGEAPTLTTAEMVSIFKQGVLAAQGRIPIIAGTGCNETRRAVELTALAKAASVNAALVVVPYYNRPTPQGCLQHYKEVSKVGLPIIVYNHPGRVGIKLPLQTLLDIASLPNVVGIKDATGDLDHTIDLLHKTKTPIFSGDDSLIVPMMASGAIGDISIVANIIPREWKILASLLLKDQIDESRELYRRYYSLVKSMVLETNPQCVKYALSLMGKCSAKMRLPLIEPSEETKKQILDAMVKTEVLLQKKNACQSAI